MKTGEEIAAESELISDTVGPTRAGWYTESCQVEYGDHTESALWKLRYREVVFEYARQLARLSAVTTAYDDILEACQGPRHDDRDCPEDDTCRCENVARLNAALAEILRLKRIIS